MTEGTTLFLIILVPLIGAALSYACGRLKKSSAGLIASAAAALSFGFVYCAFARLNVSENQALLLSAGPWFNIATLSVKWSLVFDQLSAVMCLLITGVGTLIHIYSIGYMSEDESSPRFFAYLNLFLASMLVLVLGGNLPVLFIGWEGVGLCSYLLIGFWFKNSDYSKAAQKAFVMNRIGDFGLLLAMFILFYNFNTLEISTIVAAIKAGAHSSVLLTVIGGFLLLGAVGKSAQIPLFTWLPDAMAGPTPVSALIHAATMVTAGIYLVARMFPIFEGAPDLQLLLLVVATLTAFITATIALVQTDIKKVLAYSTVSQLGFMFIALASGAYWVAIFHVLTHGFFKACLFLGAGSVIYGCHHEQDMTKMGGLWRKMPITFISFSLATFAIAGIAPFAGYYSKHAIMESCAEFVSGHPQSYLKILGNLVTLTSFLTAFYMGRCWVMTFFGKYKGEDDHHKPHEVPAVMWLPVLILAILSSVAGFILQKPLAEFLAKAIPATPEVHLANLGEALSHSLMGIGGIAAALVCFLFLPAIPALLANLLHPLQTFLKRSYFLDEVYNFIIVRPLSWIAWLLWKVGDELVLQGVEQSGILATRFTGGIGSRLQSGQVRHYALILFIGMLALVYMLIRGF